MKIRNYVDRAGVRPNDRSTIIDKRFSSVALDFDIL